MTKAILNVTNHNIPNAPIFDVNRDIDDIMWVWDTRFDDILADIVDILKSITWTRGMVRRFWAIDVIAVPTVDDIIDNWRDVTHHWDILNPFFDIITDISANDILDLMPDDDFNNIIDDIILSADWGFRPDNVDDIKNFVKSLRDADIVDIIWR